MSARNSFALNIVRFIGMAVAMALCGAVLAVTGAYLGGRVLGDDIYSSIGLAFLGIVLGYLLGNILGIVLIKRFIYPRGSLFLGIVGCIAGVAVAVTTGILWDGNVDCFLWLAIAIIPVLSLTGFYIKAL